MAKKQSKNLITIIALVLFAFLLGGCATVDYSRFVYPTGEITDKLVVELDEEKVRDAGVSISVVTAKIKRDMEDYYKQPINDFVHECLHNEAYTIAQKQYIANGIRCNVEVVGNNTVIAEVNYQTIELFNLYYGITDDELESTDDLEFREGDFVNKYVQSSQNAFAVLKTKTLKNLVNQYEVLFYDKFDINDVKLTQVYASPNVDISSNANATEISQGIKMHQWEIDPANLDFNIEFYTLSPNTGPWYILALFLTLSATVVAFVYLYYKSNKPSNKK